MSTTADRLRFAMAEASLAEPESEDWTEVLDLLDRFEALARHRANRSSRRQRAPMPEAVRAFLAERGLA